MHVAHMCLWWCTPESTLLIAADRNEHPKQVGASANWCWALHAWVFVRLVVGQQLVVCGPAVHVMQPAVHEHMHHGTYCWQLHEDVAYSYYRVGEIQILWHTASCLCRLASCSFKCMCWWCVHLSLHVDHVALLTSAIRCTRLPGKPFLSALVTLLVIHCLCTTLL